MTLTEAEHKRRVAEAERRVAEANRRAANCSAAERRAEEVANAERRAAEAEQRAAEAERRANASVVARPIITRPSQPKPIIAPAPTPAQRHTPKEIPVMTANQKIPLSRGRDAPPRGSRPPGNLLRMRGISLAPDSPVTSFLHCMSRPEPSMPGSKRAKHSRPAGTKGMARKNTIREARAASQALCRDPAPLDPAQALHSPDTLELSAAEYVARNSTIIAHSLRSTPDRKKTNYGYHRQAAGQ